MIKSVFPGNLVGDSLMPFSGAEGRVGVKFRITSLVHRRNDAAYVALCYRDEWFFVKKNGDLMVGYIYRSEGLVCV